MSIVDWLAEIVASDKVTFETSLLRLLISVLIGGLIGYERQRSKHSAGFRTFTLICVGSTVMMLLSLYLPQAFWGTYNSDPTRIAGQVITGIGFLGAGAIIQSRGAIKGLTTAASIWIISALGLAVGAGLYSVAILGTIITLFVLINLANIERRLMVEGTTKNLIVIMNCLDFESEMIESILKKYKASVHDVFIEQDMIKNQTELHFNIYVNHKTDYKKMFVDIREIPNLVSVKLLE